MARGVWPVSTMVQQFHELAGPSFYRRVDVHVERAAYPETKRRLLEDLAASPPSSLAGQPVTKTVSLETKDGFKFFVGDGSWLLIRTSGTEPLVRIYTEATTPEAQEALIGAGEQLVRG
jgi:phosphomannomutase